MIKYSLLLVFLILACERGSQDSLIVIDLNDLKPAEMKLSAMFQKEGMVALETNNSCLISNIRQVVKVKDNLFILSSHDIDNEILKFTTAGKYIGRIGWIGHGPEEYLSLRDLTVDTVNNWLIAGSDNGIYIYDFEGTFLNYYRFKTPLILEDIIWSDNSFLILGIKFKTGSEILYSLDVYDHTFTKQDSMILFENKIDKLNIVQNTTLFSDIHSGQYLYFPIIDKNIPLRDTVFQLKGNKLIPSIKLKLNSVDKNEDWEVTSDRPSFFPDFLHINEAYRTDDFLFVNYQKVMPYWFIYRFSERKGNIIRSGFTDDLLMPGYHNQLITPVPLNLRKGEFYCTLSGMSLPGKLPGINENNNPVLFFLKIKQPKSKK